MKKTFLLLFLNVSFGVFNSFSQTPLVKQWDYRFGTTNADLFFSFQQTADGGYILGGYSASGISGDKTQPSKGSTDYWILKTDSLGNKQWDKDFGGSSIEFLYSLQQTADHGYILGGCSVSDSSGDKTQNSWGSFDYWIVKIDSVGNKQWDKDFGGTNWDMLSSVKQTTDGGFILGGRSNSGIGGDKTEPNWDSADSTYDYWIVKTDSLGNKEWDKDFGGTGDDFLNSLQQTSDGKYILGGWSNSDSSGNKTQSNWDTINPISQDYWIVKIDLVGIKQWDKSFGGTEGDILCSLQQTTDGGFILGGISTSDSSGDKSQTTWNSSLDYWIVKTDSLGIKQWDKDFGGTSHEIDFGNISQTSDGGYLFAGNSFSNMSGDKSENNLGVQQSWIVKADSLGIKQWDKTLLTNNLNTEGTGFAIQLNQGCYAMANYTNAGIGGDKTQLSRGIEDYWIIKFCDTTTTTGIPSAITTAQSAITISPNPSSGIFQITFPLSSNKKTNYTLEVISTLGQTVFSSDLRLPTSDFQTNLDVSFLPKGIYVLKMNDGLSAVSCKFVIE